MKIIFLIVTAAAIIIGGASSFWLGDDNIVEEVCEKVIEQQLHVEVDLTPDSPEEKNGK